MRRASKVDTNHRDIVEALRAVGCSVQSLAALGSGYPDLLVGTRGFNLLLEVKDGSKSPSRRRLTQWQKEWQAKWRGQVATVESVNEALALVGVTA